MSGNVNVSGQEDVMRDDVSLTSSVTEEIGADEELFLNRVLAQARVDGETKFLIDWTGLPLCGATWEPKRHLNETTLTQWKSERQELRNRGGDAEKLNIRCWKEAVRQRLEAKYARHEARNNKRSQLGLQETKYPVTLQENLQNLDEILSEEGPSDVEEYSANDDGNAPGVTVHTVLRSALPKQNKPPESRQVNGGPSVGPNILPESPATQARTEPHSADTIFVRGLSPSYEAAAIAPTEPAQNSNHGNAFSTASFESERIIQLQFRREGISDPASGSNVHRSKFVGPTTRPAGISGRPATNVFAGGRVRKKRPGLLDVATNPLIQPKMLRLRHQRLLNNALKDREGCRDPGNLNALRTSAPNMRGDQGKEDESPREDPAGSSTSVRQQPALTRSGEAQLQREAHAICTTDGNSREKKKSVRWDILPKLKDPMDVDLSDKGSSQNVLPSSQSMTKKIQFGTKISTAKLTAQFHGIPNDAELLWVADFTRSDLLNFTHICTAQDFTEQDKRSAIRKKHLCGGGISSSTDSVALDTLANHLRLGVFGAICLSQAYWILVFPSKCQEWTTDNAGIFGEDTHSPLRFGIFQPVDNLLPYWLAPLSAFDTLKGQKSKLLIPNLDMTNIFGVLYDQILPAAMRGEKEQNVFLAFPPSAGPEAHLMLQWLKSSSTECNVMASAFEGHWPRFTSLGRGVVIIHEDAISSIRRFPAMSILLDTPSEVVSFWLLNRSLQFRIDGPVLAFGESRLTRIFDARTAILFAPSFLIAQPAKAYNLFKKFYIQLQSLQETDHQRKLIFCANTDLWLMNLATKKADRKRGPQHAGGEKSLSSQQEAIDSLFKLACFIRDLCHELSEDISEYLGFAPSVIDGNDEQSLINWFGWWSIRNMSNFRKFLVVGSSDLDGELLFDWIQTPHYFTGVADDPDEYISGLNGGKTEKSAVPSRLIPNDSATEIENHLRRIEHQILASSWRPVLLYRKAVSYWNLDMAFQFQDYRSEFESYRTWFKFFCQQMPGFKATTAKGINTYAGLFYTIKGKFDRKDLTPGLKSDRHPWIAIYRPVNPHIRPWRGSELLIWDLAAGEKVQGGDYVYESDLSAAQQELIRLLNESGRDKTQTMPLRKIWLGGKRRPETNYSNPLDITLEYLEKFVLELRHWAPAPENKMEDAGWKIVKQGMRAGSPLGRQKSEDDDFEGGIDLKHIFHPPRGLDAKGHTKCYNRLYRCAQIAKAAGQSEEFRYQFRPTLEWYKEQMAEGRGFDHIQVASWEGIYEQHMNEGS